MCDHLGDVSWKDIFKLSASAAASELLLELMYISLIRSIRSKLTHLHGLAACAAAIVYRNNFFRLYQQNKFSEYKGNFRQASNHCKRVLEAAKLAFANKTKESITSQKIALRTLENC